MFSYRSMEPRIRWTHAPAMPKSLRTEIATLVPSRGTLQWHSTPPVAAVSEGWSWPLREGGAIRENRSGGGFEVEEFSAPTVDEALAEASARLGLPAQELTYEIRDPGASGFLGIGSRPATIAMRTATPHTIVSPSRSSSGTYVALPRDERDASAEDPRVVMEAAQRLGTPMNKIRQRVAAGELVYDPGERRLVEATATEFEEDNEGTAVDLAENSSDPSDDRKVDTGKSAPAEYLTVPE